MSQKIIKEIYKVDIGSKAGWEIHFEWNNTSDADASVKVRAYTGKTASQEKRFAPFHIEIETLDQFLNPGNKYIKHNYIAIY